MVKISEKVADFKRLLRAMEYHNAAEGSKYTEQADQRQTCRLKLREAATELRSLDVNIEEIACFYLVSGVDYNQVCNRSKQYSK